MGVGHTHLVDRRGICQNCLGTVGVVHLPARRFVGRDAPVVVDIGDVIVVTVPQRPGRSPPLVVSNDKDAVDAAEHDFGVIVTVHIGHDRVIDDRAGAGKGLVKERIAVGAV